MTDLCSHVDRMGGSCVNDMRARTCTLLRPFLRSSNQHHSGRGDGDDSESGVVVDPLDIGLAGQQIGKVLKVQEIVVPNGRGACSFLVVAEGPSDHVLLLTLFHRVMQLIIVKGVARHVRFQGARAIVEKDPSITIVVVAVCIWWVWGCPWLFLLKARVLYMFFFAFLERSVNWEEMFGLFSLRLKLKNSPISS
jgi:hypothetical protein